MTARKRPFSRSINNLIQFIRWLILATASGLLVGAVSIAFNYALDFSGKFRQAHPWLLLCLPFAGMVIVFLYRALRYENNAGADTVIDSMHAQNESYLPLRMSFLISVSTVLTVLCGGSVGREGAAIQIGGSIGEQIGEWLHFEEVDKKILLMSGISAAFCALFGTPMAAAFLALELANVGILYYTALVPCIWASFVAHLLALLLHSPVENLRLSEVVDLTLLSAIEIMVLAMLCAAVSVLFCFAMHYAREVFYHRIQNPYMRVLAGGILLIFLTVVLRSDDYLGPGMHIIERALAGHVLPFAFLLKILFTAITIGAGFKGGEIVPSMFVGATFGALFASCIGAPVPLFASIGMVSVFCGVTNCPVTALMLSLELFGFDHPYYYLIAVAVSYMLSGYSGLYHAQKIIHTKNSRQ